MYTQKSDTQFFYADAPRKERLPQRKIVMAICAVIVLVMTAGITVLSIEKMFSVKYNQAVQLMDSNNFLKAMQEFLNFSGYRDSAAKAQECQDNIDFDSAATLLQSGDYTAARKIFAELGDFRSAPEKVHECDYADAAALMASGKPEEARDKFEALGSYSNSEEQAALCQMEIDYIAASELMNQQKFADALDAFKSLKGYKDSDDKAFVCTNYLNYAEAEKAFNKKNYYTAYVGFMQLGSFSDSADRAAACIQKKPRSGKTYYSPMSGAVSCPVTFKAPNDGYYTYIKIYKSGSLIFTLFIAPGKKVTEWLPAGTFEIRMGIGKTWFGQNEAFGDEDSYYDSSKGFKLKKGYRYTLSLRAKKGNVDSTGIGRSDF